MISCAAPVLTLVLLAQFATLAPALLLGDSRTTAPVVEGQPIEVAIGFYALDFARVTSRDESFDLIRYFELSWRDPRLALSAEDRAKAQAKTMRRLDPARIWTPGVYFENALEQPRAHAGPVVEVDPDGVVWSWAIFSAKFSTPMQLERFPFDRQVLCTRIGSFEDVSICRFRVKNELVQVGEDAFLSDWTIGKPAARVESHRYVSRQAAYSRFSYEVEVRRKATFYVWRVMLPLGLVAVVCWAAFWFDPVQLQPQVTMCMTAMIALVTFNFAVDFSLPKLTYLTLTDRHALIGFAYVVASIAGGALIHVAVIRDRLPLARSIQRAIRRAYLPAFLLAVVLNIALTLS